MDAAYAEADFSQLGVAHLSHRRRINEIGMGTRRSVQRILLLLAKNQQIVNVRFCGFGLPVNFWQLLTARISRFIEMLLLLVNFK